MAQVITFERVTPIARYDTVAWEDARIEIRHQRRHERLSTIDTIDLSTLPGGLDADPADPASRNLTTELASSTPDLWYRIVFVDGTGTSSPRPRRSRTSASTPTRTRPSRSSRAS